MGSTVHVYAVAVTYRYLFVTVYAAVTYIFLNGPDNSQKLPLHVGDLDPHLIHGSLGPPISHSKMACRDSISSFLHGSRLCPSTTDTRRERPRYSCRNKPHICYACDATQKQKKPCSGKLGIGPDHPLSDQIKFCMEVVFQGSSVISKCHQIRLSGFHDVEVKILPFRIALVVVLGPKFCICMHKYEQQFCFWQLYL